MEVGRGGSSDGGGGRTNLLLDGSIDTSGVPRAVIEAGHCQQECGGESEIYGAV